MGDGETLSDTGASDVFAIQDGLKSGFGVFKLALLVEQVNELGDCLCFLRGLERDLDRVCVEDVAQILRVYSVIQSGYIAINIIV